MSPRRSAPRTRRDRIAARRRGTEEAARQTPTPGSWLHLVEIFFRIITGQAIRRGTHRCVAELIEAIEQFIDAGNERCEPFAWTKTADDVIARAVPPTTSNSRH
jgi:hypothetical protein